MTIRDQIGALPPDAIAQVVNAYRDAYDGDPLDYHRHSHDKAHAAGCAAFREALAAVLPQEAGAPPDWTDAQLGRLFAALNAGSDFTEGRRVLAQLVGSRAPSEAAPPTDADEPPWNGWFSCPDCLGWFYGEPERYDSGDEVCAACAKIRDTPPLTLRHASDCPCGDVEPREGNAHKWAIPEAAPREPSEAAIEAARKVFSDWYWSSPREPWTPSSSRILVADMLAAAYAVDRGSPAFREAPPEPELRGPLVALMRAVVEVLNDHRWKDGHDPIQAGARRGRQWMVVREAMERARRVLTGDDSVGLTSDIVWYSESRNNSGWAGAASRPEGDGA